VQLNGKVSKYKFLQNGLPQGSVLSPIMFDAYTVDITNNSSRKFMYADDVGLAVQAESFEKVEDILNEDLVRVPKYFKSWFYTLNPKTTSIAFYLSNRDVNRKLNLIVEGTKLMNDDAPKYLGIKMDRTLTYNQHLEDLKNKLKTRNNIISKLAGTSWGCRANVLRISALALVYCAPVWERSVHAKKVNTQLRRIITGCIRATNLL